jgi:SnoaL-like domain
MDALERLVAESDIRQLLALYPQHADDGEHQAFADLFAEHGSIHIGEQPIEGRAAIREWIASTDAAGPMRHLMLNSYICVTSPDEAHGSLDMALLGQRDGRWIVRTAPRYADSFVRTVDGWRFAKREITFR